MKYDKTFVLSDIHGELAKFKELLQYWKPNEENLVILGDLIDRGEHSLEIVQLAMDLKNTYNEQVVVLKGNHEDMLSIFLSEKDYETGDWYFNNGGNRTCESFTHHSFPLYFHSYEERANKMLQVSNKEIQFLKQLPLHCEFGDTLFVHAGINPHLNDWRKSVEKDFLWTRGHWNHPNEIGKTIIFGHTPVRHIHDSDEVWVSKCKSYIGIDGGAVFKGQLNGIVIDKKGQILEKYKV